MIPESFLKNFPTPLPQVGAVLRLDTELPVDYCKGGKHWLKGGKHWKLAGSCVLVASDRVLTIGHILEEHEKPLPDGRYCAFFPYEGLFEFPSEIPEWEIQRTKGDNLARVHLEGHVKHCAPLPIRERSRHKERRRALVCGYGSWPQSPLARLEGIQQRQLVRLGRPADGDVQWSHYDNLDLSWWASLNGGLKAGRGNSGGLMTKLRGEPVAGIIRETGEDQQAGSWITESRWDWLNELVQTGQAHAPGRGRRSWLLQIDAEKPGKTIRFEVPENATYVKATLNASQGMRLQMGIVQTDQSEGLLDSLQGNDDASGRFLFRDLALKEGTREITIGVCPVKKAPQLAKAILAQVCVLFL